MGMLLWGMLLLLDLLLLLQTAVAPQRFLALPVNIADIVVVAELASMSIVVVAPAEAAAVAAAH